MADLRRSIYMGLLISVGTVPFFSELTVAFRVQRTNCSPFPSCIPTAPFAAPGPYAHWNLETIGDRKVHYVVNPTGSGLPDAGVRQAIGNAFGSWEAVESAVIQFHGDDFNSSKKAGLDGTNTLLWDEDGSFIEQAGLDLDTAIALTAAYLDGSTGEILDADIAFNGVRFTWSISEQKLNMRGGGIADLQSIATHEIGHLVGLDESPKRKSTMFPFAPRKGLGWRTLERDDMLGISFLYPFVYVSSSTQGTIHRIDTVTGESRLIIDGLVSPEDIATDLVGNLYVAEPFADGTGTIERINPESGTREVVTAAICGPEGPSFDTDGNLFVNTRGGHPECTHSGIWEIKDGRPGRKSRNVVDGFSTWGEGTVFLTQGPFDGDLLGVDSGGRVIRAERRLFRGFGPPISFLDVGEILVGISVDSRSHIFVSLVHAGIIKEYNEEGDFVQDFATGLTSPSGPHFLDFDGSDNMYVAEFATGNILKFSNDGAHRLLTTVSGAVGIAVPKVLK